MSFCDKVCTDWEVSLVALRNAEYALSSALLGNLWIVERSLGGWKGVECMSHGVHYKSLYH